MNASRHYWILAIALLLGTGLRFWQLDAKPLWMDEVITALFSTGHSYFDVPLQQALPVSAFEQLFAFNPNATCAQIVETVSVQSVHPPLFFCWLHSWLGWVNGLPLSWVWKLRALPVLFGAGAIAALYQLNRIAFSVRAGLFGAAVMAVSPFAVYLSQEARHYSLPMLLVTLALLGLYEMLVDLQQRRFRLTVWLGWIAVNSIGFYVHYFFLLAFLAQAGVLMIHNSKLKTLFGLSTPNQGRDQSSQVSLRPYLAIAMVCLTYVPWLPTLLSHMGRSETDWMKQSGSGLSEIAPLYQLVIGWVLMVVALPVEQQPLWVAIPSALLMLVFAIWLAKAVGEGIRILWRSPETQLAAHMLGLFTLLVVGAFLAIAYASGKDLTQVPRYNFIYFPAVCALIGAGLASLPSPRSPLERPAWGRLESTVRPVRWRRRSQVIAVVLLVGGLSSSVVVGNGVFQKPYDPDQVAQDMLLEPALPMLTVVSYSDWQNVALGVSFALGVQRHSERTPQAATRYFAFLPQQRTYEEVWNAIATLQHPLAFPLNLWVVAPGLKRVGYVSILTLKDAVGKPHPCVIDPAQYHRIGVPYQLYRCR